MAVLSSMFAARVRWGPVFVQFPAAKGNRRSHLPRYSSLTQRILCMESALLTGLGIVPWIVPILALLGLAITKVCDAPQLQRFGERVFFAALLLVAGATLHTVACNNPFWLIHTSSLALMTVGAVIR
jgi:hypothetical protein